MARYTGPREKIARRFGVPLFGPSKALELRNFPPGQHGVRNARRKVSDYGIAMAEKQKSIDELRRGLDLVYTRGTVYDLKKKEKAAREARIASIQPLIYSSLLEEAQKSLTNGTVRGEEEKPSVEVVPGVLTKRLYGFEVKGVALEELLNFLTKLEQDPGHFLIVERLAIKSPSALEDRLNVEVELATWEMLKQPEGEAAAEGSEP